MPDHSGLARFNDYLGTQVLGTMFRLTRGPKTLVCELRTHPLGWELRVSSADALPRTQVCKTEDDVFDTAAAWKATALTAGWTE